MAARTKGRGAGDSGVGPRKWVWAVALASTAVGAVTGLFNTVSSQSLILMATGVGIAAGCTVVAWRRVVSYRLPDLGAAFLLAFAFYNAITPLEVGLRLSIAEGQNFKPRGYPVAFDPEVYVYAALATGIVGAILCITLWPRTAAVGPRRTDPTLPGVFTRPSSVWIGVGLYSVGILLAILHLAMVGGIRAAFVQARGARLDQFNYGEAQAIPYWVVLLVGLCFISFYYFHSSDRRALRVLVVALAGYSIYQVGLGSRSSILWALIVVLGCYLVADHQVFRHKIKITVVVVLACYVVFAAFGQFRSFLPALFQDRVQAEEAMSRIARRAAPSWLIPSDTELAGTYLSLLYNIEYYQGDLAFGTTYLEGMLAVIPERVYPEKPTSLAREFAQDVEEEVGGPGSRARGRGFNIVAEAMYNFGILGLIIVPLALGLGLRLLSDKMYRGPVSYILGVVLLTQAVHLNRTSFTLLNVLLLATASGAAVLAAHGIEGRRRIVGGVTTFKGGGVAAGGR